MTKTDFLSQLTTAALECEKAAGIPHAFTLDHGALCLACNLTVNVAVNN